MSPSDWCQFQAMESTGIFVEQAFLGSAVMLQILTIMSIWKHRSAGTFTPNRTTYLLMLVWLNFFTAKTLISIVVYECYILEGASIDQLNVWSSLFFLLDELTTYSLMTLLLRIPIKWMSNMMGIISEVDPKDSRILDIFFKINFIQCKIYWNARLGALFLFVTTFILSLCFESNSTLKKLNVVFFILESFIVSVCYLIGLIFLKKLSYAIEHRLTSNKLIICEYITMMAICVTRLVYNSLTTLGNLEKVQPNDFCYDETKGEQLILNTLFLGLSLLLMQILPGISIIYVYWPSQEKSVKTKASLLDSRKDLY